MLEYPQWGNALVVTSERETRYEPGPCRSQGIGDNQVFSDSGLSQANLFDWLCQSRERATEDR